MKEFRYLENVTTLKLDADKCIGCGMCEVVCPHTVFRVQKLRAYIIDQDGCMECGACASNCPVEAISVNPGVGCAAYIVQKWLKGKGIEVNCC